MRFKNTTPFSKVPEGHVRVAPLQGLAQLIRALGGNPEVLFRSLKINEKNFTNPDYFLPLAVRGLLLEGAAAETGCEHLGLLIGSKSSALELGIPGRLLLASATVGDALNVFQQHWHLHNPSSVVLHARRDNEALFGYSLLDGNVHGMQQLSDGAMALALNLMRQMLGADWCPSGVTLMRREPQNPAFYSEYFGAPCSFNAVRSALYFPAEMMDRALLIGNGDSAALAVNVSEELLMQCEPPVWKDHVHGTIFSLLLLEDCSLRRVAEALAISSRTLNRRLEQLGLSYLSLVEQSRFAVSRMLMKETNLPLARIARALGYAEPSSFSRAFRRWAGCPPETWRKEKTGLAGAAKSARSA